MKKSRGIKRYGEGRQVVKARSTKSTNARKSQQVEADASKVFTIIIEGRMHFPQDISFLSLYEECRKIEAEKKKMKKKKVKVSYTKRSFYVN